MITQNLGKKSFEKKRDTPLLRRERRHATSLFRRILQEINFKEKAPISSKKMKAPLPTNAATVPSHYYLTSVWLSRHIAIRLFREVDEELRSIHEETVSLI